MPITTAGNRSSRPRLLGVGVQNLFDTFPDENGEANSNLGIFPYPSHARFGMNGRFVYSRIAFRF